MQKTIRIGSIIYLCLVCFTASAQEEKVKVKSKESGLEKKNIIKLNLPALAFRNISVQYERAVGKRTSVAMQVRTIPFGKLPFHSTFENIADDPDIQITQFKLGSFGVVPEFRYYVGKKGALHGFYFGPFLSISNYKMNLPITFSGGATTKTGIFDGKLNAVTGGLQLGAQFSLGKNVVLDWWILGPNYGSANGTLTYTAGTPLTNAERDDLQSELDQLKEDAPLSTIKTAVATNSGAVITAKGPWGGLRGLGFSVGFKF